MTRAVTTSARINFRSARVGVVGARSQARRLLFAARLSATDFRRSRLVSLAVAPPIVFLAARFASPLIGRLLRRRQSNIGWRESRRVRRDGRYTIRRRLRSARRVISRRDQPAVEQRADARCGEADGASPVFHIHIPCFNDAPGPPIYANTNAWRAPKVPGLPTARLSRAEINSLEYGRNRPRRT